MKEELHPITKYWLATTFGVDREPFWWSRRKQLIARVHHLWNLRQRCYYEGTDPDEFRDARRSLSMGLKIRFEHLDLLLGVCCTDPANGYGCLRDFFLAGDPKLTRIF